MIMTLKTTLIRGRYYEHEWSANIELDESSTLAEFHDAIQMAVDFENDHMFCFYRSRTDRSRDREYFDDENGLLFSKTLKDVFPLPPKQSFFYLFDWGDEWIFKISPTRKRPHEPAAGVTYPKMDGGSGTMPVQYPTDDEDDEE